MADEDEDEVGAHVLENSALMRGRGGEAHRLHLPNPPGIARSEPPRPTDGPLRDRSRGRFNNRPSQSTTCQRVRAWRTSAASVEDVPKGVVGLLRRQARGVLLLGGLLRRQAIRHRGVLQDGR